MTIEELRERGLIIFECISGSRAYGLHTAQSDVDIRGIFVQPQREYYGLRRVPQVANATNDVVFYELGRFMELVAANNPNILELLNTPQHTILQRSAVMDMVDVRGVLSKRCMDTFGRFALSQIKKAQGLNKKINQPMEVQRKGVLDFCYVANGQGGSMPVERFLALRGWRQEDCGLVNVANMQEIYALYHSAAGIYRGLVRKEESNELALSSIPKGEEQAALLFFNRNGYSMYCREYREYWQWVERRNEVRYESTLRSGKNYDAKNMMHTFRLLDMAIEIAQEKRINVERPNRELLLSIKRGDWEFADLMDLAARKQAEMEAAFAESDLPDEADWARIDACTAQMRAAVYAACARG